MDTAISYNAYSLLEEDQPQQLIDTTGARPARRFQVDPLQDRPQDHTSLASDSEVPVVRVPMHTSGMADVVQGGELGREGVSRTHTDRVLERSQGPTLRRNPSKPAQRRGAETDFALKMRPVKTLLTNLPPGFKYRPTPQEAAQYHAEESRLIRDANQGIDPESAFSTLRRAGALMRDFGIKKLTKDELTDAISTVFGEGILELEILPKEYIETLRDLLDNIFEAADAGSDPSSDHTPAGLLATLKDKGHAIALAMGSPLRADVHRPNYEVVSIRIARALIYYTSLFAYTNQRNNPVYEGQDTVFDLLQTAISRDRARPSTKMTKQEVLGAKFAYNQYTNTKGELVDFSTVVNNPGTRFSRVRKSNQLVREFYDPPPYDTNPTDFQNYLKTIGVTNHQYHSFQLRTRSQLEGHPASQCISDTGTGLLYVEGAKPMFYKPAMSTVGADPIMVEILGNAEQYHQIRNTPLPSTASELIALLPDTFYGTGTYEGLERRLRVGYDSQDALRGSTQLTFTKDLFLQVFPQAEGPKVKLPHVTNGTQYIQSVSTLLETALRSQQPSAPTLMKVGPDEFRKALENEAFRVHMSASTGPLFNTGSKQTKNFEAFYTKRKSASELTMEEHARTVVSLLDQFCYTYQQLRDAHAVGGIPAVRDLIPKMSDFICLAKPKAEVMSREKFETGKHRFIYAINQHVQNFFKVPLLVFKERTLNPRWFSASPAQGKFALGGPGEGIQGITPMYGFSPQGAAGQMVDLLKALRPGEIHLMFYSDNVYVLENAEGTPRILSLDGQSYEISFQEEDARRSAEIYFSNFDLSDPATRIHAEITTEVIAHFSKAGALLFDQVIVVAGQPSGLQTTAQNNFFTSVKPVTALAELVNIYNSADASLFSKQDRDRIRGLFPQSELDLMNQKGLTYGLTQWHNTRKANLPDATFQGFTQLFALCGVILKFDVDPNAIQFQDPLQALQQDGYVAYDLLGTAAQYLEPDHKYPPVTVLERSRLLQSLVASQNPRALHMDLHPQARKAKMAKAHQTTPHEFLASLAAIISKHDSLGFMGAYIDEFLTECLDSARYLLVSTILQMTGMSRGGLTELVQTAARVNAQSEENDPDLAHIQQLGVVIADRIPPGPTGSYGYINIITTPDQLALFPEKRDRSSWLALLPHLEVGGPYTFPEVIAPKAVLQESVGLMNFLTGDPNLPLPEVRIDQFRFNSLSAVVDAMEVQPEEELYPSGPRNQSKTSVVFLRVSDELVADVLQNSMYVVKTQATRVFEEFYQQFMVPDSNLRKKEIQVAMLALSFSDPAQIIGAILDHKIITPDESEYSFLEGEHDLAALTKVLRFYPTDQIVNLVIHMIKQKLSALEPSLDEIRKIITPILAGEVPPSPVNLRKYVKGFAGVKSYIDHLASDYGYHTWQYIRGDGPVYLAWQATSYSFAQFLASEPPQNLSDLTAKKSGYLKLLKKNRKEVPKRVAVTQRMDKAQALLLPYVNMFLEDDGRTLQNAGSAYVPSGFVVRLIKAYMTELVGQLVVGPTVKEFFLRFNTAKAGRPIRVVLPRGVAATYLRASGPPVPKVDFLGRMLKKPITREGVTVYGPPNTYGYALLANAISYKTTPISEGPWYITLTQQKKAPSLYQRLRAERKDKKITVTQQFRAMQSHYFHGNRTTSFINTISNLRVGYTGRDQLQSLRENAHVLQPQLSRLSIKVTGLASNAGDIGAYIRDITSVDAHLATLVSRAVSHRGDPKAAKLEISAYIRRRYLEVQGSSQLSSTTIQHPAVAALKSRVELAKAKNPLDGTEQAERNLKQAYGDIIYEFLLQYLNQTDALQLAQLFHSLPTASLQHYALNYPDLVEAIQGAYTTAEQNGDRPPGDHVKPLRELQEYKPTPGAYRGSTGPQVDVVVNALIHNFGYLSTLPRGTRPSGDGTTGGFLNYLAAFCRTGSEVNVVGREGAPLQGASRGVREFVLRAHYSSESIDPRILATHALLAGCSTLRMNDDPLLLFQQPRIPLEGDPDDTVTYEHYVVANATPVSTTTTRRALTSFDGTDEQKYLAPFLLNFNDSSSLIDFVNHRSARNLLGYGDYLITATAERPNLRQEWVSAGNIGLRGRYVTELLTPYSVRSPTLVSPALCPLWSAIINANIVIAGARGKPDPLRKVATLRCDFTPTGALHSLVALNVYACLRPSDGVSNAIVRAVLDPTNQQNLDNAAASVRFALQGQYEEFNQPLLTSSVGQALPIPAPDVYLGLGALIELALPEYRYTVFAEKVSKKECPVFASDILEQSRIRQPRADRPRNRDPIPGGSDRPPHTAWAIIGRDFARVNARPANSRRRAKALQPVSHPMM